MDPKDPEENQTLETDDEGVETPTDDDSTPSDDSEEIPEDTDLDDDSEADDETLADGTPANKNVPFKVVAKQAKKLKEKDAEIADLKQENNLLRPYYDVIQANPELKEKVNESYSKMNPEERTRAIIQAERVKDQLSAGQQRIEAEYPNATGQRSELMKRANGLVQAGVDPTRAYEEAYYAFNRNKMSKDKARSAFNEQGKSPAPATKIAKETPKTKLVITEEDRKIAASVNMTPEAYVKSKTKHADKFKLQPTTGI